MKRSRRPILAASLVLGTTGCVYTPVRLPSGAASARASHEPAPPLPPAPPPLPAAVATAPPDMAGPRPLGPLLDRALAENRTVQAAFHNVQALRHRITQATALEDPIASNSIFAIPSVAPQYSLMGYNPYNLTLAQQFPWFGTLKLRGQTAERDVQVALAELAAAQLDAVAAVKRAYCNLYAALKTREILQENRKLLESFQTIAQSRLRTGGSQQDVLRSEVLISELDRERAANDQAVASARAALARQLHVRADNHIETTAELPTPSVTLELEALNRLAAETRPELVGRLAAIERDQKAAELARKRFYPNVTLGLTYMDMTRDNAVAPRTASGSPNIGLFVGFTLPVYRNKYQAGVAEAQERTFADAKLLEAQQDETSSEIQDLLAQAKVQGDVLALLREQIMPRIKKTLENAISDYAKSNADLATPISAMREVLQVQIQVVQVEAELGKALASLERAVGRELASGPATNPAAPRPTESASPFTKPAPATDGGGPR